MSENNQKPTEISAANVDTSAATSTDSQQKHNWYKNSKVPVKALDVLIIVGIIAMVIVTAIMVKNGGFTVTFESDGGSMVQSQKLDYGVLIEEPEQPVKEGYVFDGWYSDIEREKSPWNFQTDKITDSITLYAKWSATPT